MSTFMREAAFALAMEVGFAIVVAGDGSLS